MLAIDCQPAAASAIFPIVLILSKQLLVFQYFCCQIYSMCFLNLSLPIASACGLCNAAMQPVIHYSFTRLTNHIYNMLLYSTHIHTSCFTSVCAQWEFVIPSLYVFFISIAIAILLTSLWTATTTVSTLTCTFALVNFPFPHIFGI